jgi:hypothetical protein
MQLSHIQWRDWEKVNRHAVLYALLAVVMYIVIVVSIYNISVAALGYDWDFTFSTLCD